MKAKTASLALPLTIICLGGPFPSFAKPADSTAPCDAAVEVLRHLAQEPGRPSQVLSSKPISTGLWVVEDQRPQPPKSLFDRLEAAPESSALLTCPGLSRQAHALGFETGNGAERTAMRDALGRPIRVYRSEIVGMSLPVLSADANEALVSYGTSRGLVGYSGIIYLRRDSTGRWSVAGDEGLTSG
jgi:hypothetical protein